VSLIELEPDGDARTLSDGVSDAHIIRTPAQSPPLSVWIDEAQATSSTTAIVHHTSLVIARPETKTTHGTTNRQGGNEIV
jgi:hypothetical protein